MQAGIEKRDSDVTYKSVRPCKIFFDGAKSNEGYPVVARYDPKA